MPYTRTAGVAIDQLDEESISAGFAAAVAAAGQIDVLVNNAVNIEPGDISTGTFDAFVKTQVRVGGGGW